MCELDNATAVSCPDRQQYVKDAASKHDIDGQLEEELSPSNCCLLELAAENDLEGFCRHVEESNCKVDVAGPWYVRMNGSKRMVLEWRTPAMIAALYGSLDVVDFIVKHYALYGGELNQKCGHDGSTALHCAAAGGSEFALKAAQILLESGADPTARDAFGRQPCDVIDVPFWLGHIKKGLTEILKPARSSISGGIVIGEFSDHPNKYLPRTSPDRRRLSPEDGDSAEARASMPCSSIISELSSISSVCPSSCPNYLHVMGAKLGSDGAEKVRDYPFDPPLPDIKNGIYTTDEFRMYSFKIRPCSRAYCHDWTECPFVHPGENARRRDPRRYHYSCIPCPEFRKGPCRRGDTCEHAHGVFECWLHPAQYRTRFCKDGNSCNRRVCFFAHTAEELRSLYASTGCSVVSPMSSGSVDMPLICSPLAPGFPSIPLPLSHLQFAHTIHGIPSMFSSSSPSSLTGTQAHQTVSFLHVPETSLLPSRFRSSNASVSDSLAFIDFEGQNSLPSQFLFTQACLNAADAASCGSCYASLHAGKCRNLGINELQNNMEKFFEVESILTPKSLGHDTSVISQFEEQLLTQRQILWSPVSSQTQQLQAPQADSETHFSCRTKSSAIINDTVSQISLLEGLHAEGQGTNELPVLPILAVARAGFAQRDQRSHSSRDLGANDISSDWGSPSGKLEWSFHNEELLKLSKSSSLSLRSAEEPDISWVHKLVKEMPPETNSKSCFYPTVMFDAQRERAKSSLPGSWFDKLSLDQIDS